MSDTPTAGPLSPDDQAEILRLEVDRLTEANAALREKLDESKEVLDEHLDTLRRRGAFLEQALELGERFKSELATLLEHHGLKP